MYKLVVDDYSKFIQDLRQDSDRKTAYSLLKTNNKVTEELTEPMKPIKMLVTIRTDLTNEVLVSDTCGFYTDCTLSFTEPCSLDEAVVMSAKSLVDKLFDCKEHTFDAIRRTVLQPLGVFVYREQVYIYTNIIMDSKLKKEEYFHVRDSHFEPIRAQKPYNKLEEELIECLVIS